MTYNNHQTPPFGASTSSLAGLVSDHREPPRFASRRPRGLVLKEQRKPAEASLFAEEELNASSCGVCRQSLEYNPRLCGDCQIWNDTAHVFQCLGNVDEWWDRPVSTLKGMTQNQECHMCQVVTNAVLSRFPVETDSLKQELMRTEVRNLGPYCLGAEELEKLDARAFQASGKHRVDRDDLRLSPSWDSRTFETGSQGASHRIKVVLYLVVTAPVGTTIRETFPEIDAQGGDGENTTLGCHRIAPEGGPGLLPPTIGLQVELQYAQAFKELLSLKPWENEFIDINRLSGWVNNCEKKHGEKCRRKSQISLPRGFKAIDVERHCIVELLSQPVPSYAALSYTWGPPSQEAVPELQLERANYTALTQEGALRKFNFICGIPAVILDAITLCQSLGERYLWVDRLCIVQDDSQSKHSQIQAMDRIYQGALFTIIAATPLGAGLPGVSNRPRKSSLRNISRRFHPNLRFVADNFKNTAISSFWNTRGWTYQERLLSQRSIYITEFDLYFICGKRSEHEDTGEFASVVNPWDFKAVPQYFHTVVDYTARNLSFKSDILNAFAGIGNVIAKEMETELIFGLPERILSRTLLWEMADESKRRIEAPEIPSWSWAACNGRVKYEMNSRVEKLRIGNLISFYFQDPRQGLRRVGEETVWFFKNMALENFQHLPTVDAEYPEMRFMPSPEQCEADWRECPHNPWTGLLRQHIDPYILEQASQYPGSLVFRTTLANVRLQSRHQGNGKGMENFEILDQTDAVVGQMERLHSSDVSERDGNASHEIIVLSGGILAEPSRFSQMRASVMEGSPWYLHVMLIRRDPSGVARRQGIGAVEMRRWAMCDPKWCSIILV